jgi:gluconokinase
MMGVAGSGKTTLGMRVAHALGWEFADWDNFHSAANIEKMAQGIPLTDEDRAPWLATLRRLIKDWLAAGKGGVLACSALKAIYRDELKVDSMVVFLYLKASPELLLQRLRARPGHYMKAGMLESQLATLEQPANAIVVDVSGPIEQTVQTILKEIGKLNPDERQKGPVSGGC